ncbi:MAG TPA: NAD+ synthase [Candidatus Latescibacteria bacterium]|nr:NAD+ synthase [Candidatus Latescibacterota bacterium]
MSQREVGDEVLPRDSKVCLNKPPHSGQGRPLRIAMAQINTTVGDLEGNFEKIREYVRKAKDLQVDVASFPELAITGYPPEDLLLKPRFVQDNLRQLERLARSIEDIVVVVGFVDRLGTEIYNAAAIIHKGEICGVYHKMLLPNYGVFDEKRYFNPGQRPLIFKTDGVVFGVNICEDIWHEDGPTRRQASLGASLILNINASPYHAGKIKEREDIVSRQARDNRVFITYTNLVGGQDELVFDGQSMVVDDEGKTIARAEPFKEDLLVIDLNVPPTLRETKGAITIAKEFPEERPPLPEREVRELEPVEEIYQALVLGLKDYVSKNGFKKVIIGLSGGIDSSLTAAVAVDAMGKDGVYGVFMPSEYTSEESREDVEALVKNLGIHMEVIPITEIFGAYLRVFAPVFKGCPQDVTEENLQARIRGNILMALSNKFGWLVLTTGNKSEVSTGYCTLYGDMVGGFGVIKDVPKTLVYELARFRNELENGEIIPERVLRKPPTAELKPDQKDTDTLPPYEILDPILKSYIEEDKSFQDIIRQGYDGGIVSRVIRMVDGNEYKRRQAPPGIKITPKAFGKDRRMPITNRYKGFKIIPWRE